VFGVTFDRFTLQKAAAVSVAKSGSIMKHDRTCDELTGNRY